MLKSQQQVLAIRIHQLHSEISAVWPARKKGRPRSDRGFCRCPEQQITIPVGTLNDVVLLVTNTLDDAASGLVPSPKHPL